MNLYCYNYYIIVYSFYGQMDLILDLKNIKGKAKVKR